MSLWIHRRLSRLRPVADDSVKTCGHSSPTHYLFDATSQVDRMRWLALCRECFVLHAHQPEVAVGVPMEAA
jgi:hypothetical protein